MFPLLLISWVAVVVAAVVVEVAVEVAVVEVAVFPLRLHRPDSSGRRAN